MLPPCAPFDYFTTSSVGCEMFLQFTPGRLVKGEIDAKNPAKCPLTVPIGKTVGKMLNAVKIMAF
jgi:hypothetical protein